ncbi:hypothetical protein LTR56_017459 [Elasticomyces elasticus]|nr:hypothetical protein LTR56_017459 [Elasticomyces elasticus]KAK3640871.1 hypothetical protein LTR22_016793 [Elasticomyces elasticus]KAK5759060.1 hypothetical protein LTS12_010832 [Elasticomyces elasticus]
MASVRQSAAGLICATFQPIAVIVGPPNATRTFYLYFELATTHSAFLASATKEVWLPEGRVVRIPSRDPELFAYFAGFLMTGKILTIKSGTKSTDENEEEWELLARLWVLGDFLLSTSFKDAVVDALISKVADEGTMGKKAFNEESAGFFRDVAVRQAVMSEEEKMEGFVLESDSCKYHGHGEGACYKGMCGSAMI